MSRSSATGRTRRWTWGVLLLFALLARQALGQPSQRATAVESLRDAATWRATLGRTLHATVQSAELAAGPIHLRIDGDAITLDPDGTSVVVRTDDASAPWPLRLLSALLTTQPLEAALDALNAPLQPALLTWDTHTASVPAALVRRIGTDAAQVWLADGTSAPHAVHVRRSDGLWRADVVAWSEAVHGWYPERVQVMHNDEVVLDLALLDLAPRLDSLAPLVASNRSHVAQPPGERTARWTFPRLDL
jgi:hypothetical protein